jgi:hypothetical protein
MAHQYIRGYPSRLGYVENSLLLKYGRIRSYLNPIPKPSPAVSYHFYRLPQPYQLPQQEFQGVTFIFIQITWHLAISLSLSWHHVILPSVLGQSSPLALPSMASQPSFLPTAILLLYMYFQPYRLTAFIDILYPSYSNLQLLQEFLIQSIPTNCRHRHFCPTPFGPLP